MIHHQVPRNPKFRPAGSEKEVFAATTCPKCHPICFSYHFQHKLTCSSCKNHIRRRDKGQCHCGFFFAHEVDRLDLFVSGHHEDCVFDVNTHTAGFFLLVFCIDMSSQAILTHFKCSILFCSLKWA